MALSDFTPTVDQVAALLRARTRDENGVELGTFNEHTRPTGTEAATLIAMAAQQVAAVIGTDPVTLVATERAQEVLDAATQAVALRAALLIESSYFPEQIAAGESPFLQLRELSDLQVTAVGQLIDANQPGQAQVYSIPIVSSTTIGQTALTSELIP